MPDPETLRRASAKDRVLELFKAKRVVTNVELGQVCQRYGARIWEAKKEGHRISEPVCLEPGIYQYTYEGWEAPGQLDLWSKSA